MKTNGRVPAKMKKTGGKTKKSPLVRATLYLTKRK
jgi:hypothetical protein